MDCGMGYMTHFPLPSLPTVQIHTAAKLKLYVRDLQCHCHEYMKLQVLIIAKYLLYAYI